MHDFWPSLTPRGRGFLTAGTAALVCGLVLGERDLVAVGAVLVLLPIATAVWLFGGDVDIDVVRSISRQRVETGQPVEVVLRLSGGSRTRRVLLRENLPYALGTSPRYIIEGRLTDDLTASYTVRSEMRGRYSVGPTTVVTGDPFGLLSRQRELAGTDRIVVTPRPDPLVGTPVVLGDGRTVGEFHPRSFVGGDATDVTIRDYRLGDDLRRVHWPSTARIGDLMVRREERPRQTSCTLLLDNRLDAHRGTGSRSSLECAIRATASVALHLVHSGCRVHPFDATGLPLLDEGRDEQPATASEAVLTALALLPGTTRNQLDDDWSGHTGDGFVIAVLGSLREHDLNLLARVGRHASDRLALVIDVDAWASDGHHDAPATIARLRTSGWRAVLVGPDTRVADAWQALGR